MRPVEAQMEAARALLASAHACAADASAEEWAVAAGRAYETLHQSFAPAIGAAGLGVLFSRSVKLTGDEFPCLRELVIAADGSDAKQVSQQLVRCVSKLKPVAASEVATSLYATLFGLMTAFIGERLVWQVLKRAFPVTQKTGSKENE